MKKKAPCWKKLVVLASGEPEPIRKTRRFWMVLDRWYTFGETPQGYEVRLESGEPCPSVVDCLGLPEVLEERTQKHARKAPGHEVAADVAEE